jgi:hypothetical protein
MRNNILNMNNMTLNVLNTLCIRHTGLGRYLDKLS